MKKAVMYGAGNIGRGFIGQLFSESGYEVVFIDVNMEIVEELNNRGKYTVCILSAEGGRDITVSNIRAVDGRDLDRVAEEIAGADIMATAVGVNVLPRIAGPIARGLKKRWRQGRMDPFNIIICENLLEADSFLAELIEKELDEEEKNHFRRLTGLVEASIGRMVPVMTAEMQKGDVTRVCVEEYGELPVDRDGFKGEIPGIVNMLPFSPFAFYIQRKLFIHNMGHAIAAYLGKLKGYVYIWQAMEDPLIRRAVCAAMGDSAAALSAEHGVDIKIVLEHVEDLVKRFGNRQLGDTVSRVGNDLRRKLSPRDRLVGAARLCESHGISPLHICLGIAAALKFDPAELSDFREPEDVLTTICDLSERDWIYATVMRLYNMLESIECIDEVIETVISCPQEAGDYKRDN